MTRLSNTPREAVPATVRRGMTPLLIFRPYELFVAWRGRPFDRFLFNRRLAR